MKKLLSIAAAMALSLVASVASAHEFKVGEIEIIHPNAKAMLPGAPVGGGFMTITNHGSTDDTLVSASCACADEVQLHEMAMENDVMKMRQLKDGIPVPAGETVELKPGGLHVMFMKVTQPFKEGDMVKATLTFEKAGPVDVEFMVGPAGGEMKHDHSKMDMSGSGASN